MDEPKKKPKRATVSDTRRFVDSDVDGIKITPPPKSKKEPKEAR